MPNTTISDTLYNNIVDELTYILKAEGYHVVKSNAYPENGEDKYIIWANATKGKAFRFCWPGETREPELLVAGYAEDHLSDEPEWQFVESVFCGYDDMTAAEQTEVVQIFVNAYKAGTKGKIAVPAAPGAKPKLENVLGKAIFSTTGIAVLWFLFKVFIKGCN